MAKMKSTLKNMFLSLTLICLIAGGVLAAVNQVTAEPIRLAQRAKLENAIREVVPPFTNSPSEEVYQVAVAADDTLLVYPAKEDDRIVGLAVQTSSRRGYGGDISLLVGITTDGELIDYAVLSHAETPGLGSKMDTWFKTDKNNQNILGLHLSGQQLRVKNDGGDVDAITASTITSRAFLEAINKAYAAYAELKGEELPDGRTDATSSATSVETPPDGQTDATSSATP